MANHIYSAKKSDNLFGERHCSGDLVSFRIKVPGVVSVGPSVVFSPSCGLCAIKRAFTAASDRYMSLVYTVPLMWTLRRGTVGFMIGGIARHRSRTNTTHLCVTLLFLPFRLLGHGDGDHMIHARRSGGVISVKPLLNRSRRSN